MRQRRRQKCPIQEHIKLICPNCSAVVEVPMCKVVNGETVICPFCHQELSFPASST